MNYLLKSKYTNPFKTKIISIISLVIIFLLLSTFFSKSIRTFFTTISEPLWSVSQNVSSGTSNLFGFFSFKSSLISKIKITEDEIALLKTKQLDYDVITKENQDLKSMQGAKISNNRILSRVLSKPPQSPYDTFVIDAGQNDGVVVGDNVYIFDTILSGVVTSQTPSSSVVEFFSKGDKKTITENSRTGSSYELSGRGGGNFTVEVPKDADILWGDVFMYPSLSPSVLGSVYYIETNPQSSFKKIYIRIPVNIFQIKWVYVEK